MIAGEVVSVAGVFGSASRTLIGRCWQFAIRLPPSLPVGFGPMAGANSRPARHKTHSLILR